MFSVISSEVSFAWISSLAGLHGCKQAMVGLPGPRIHYWKYGERIFYHAEGLGSCGKHFRISEAEFVRESDRRSIVVDLNRSTPNYPSPCLSSRSYSAASKWPFDSAMSPSLSIF